jgi:hypothetical protein
MTEKRLNYAQLNLYFGLCDCDLVMEGEFEKHPTREYQKERNLEAFNVVQRAIVWDMVGIGGGSGLVGNLKEAQDIIIYSDNNIKGATDKIELIDCMHGSLRFYQHILFYNWLKEQEPELINELKKSGFKANPKRYYFIESLDGIHNKFNEDYPWFTALEFYENDQLVRFHGEYSKPSEKNIIIPKKIPRTDLPK